MKILETVQKHLASIGFRPNEKPFNINQLKFIFMGLVGISSISIYLFCIANTQKECMDAFFMMMIGITCHIL